LVRGPRDHVRELDAEIETLSDIAERCRKIVGARKGGDWRVSCSPSPLYEGSLVKGLFPGL